MALKLNKDYNDHPMKDNSRFALAVHTLTLLAEKDMPLPSNFIARSAGVNAVTVRKLVGQLRVAGLVTTQTGPTGGTTLARPADEITLKDAFMAARDEDIFGSYPDSPDPQCTVGGNLKPVLQGMLSDAMQTMVDTLERSTIADVLAGIVEANITEATN